MAHLTLSRSASTVFLNGNTNMNAEIPKSLPEGTFQLPVHFVKSNYFRVIHTVGAWFGGDGHGNIHMSFYNERTAIPKSLVLTIDQSGSPVAESNRESKQGFVREMEVDIVITYQDALALHSALGENLKSIQEMHRKTAAERSVAIQELLKK